MLATLFSELNAAERARIDSLLVTNRYRRGQVIFHEGDAAAALHLIERGRVAVRVTTAEGETTTLRVQVEGEAFGEQALFSPGAVRSATVAALTDTVTRSLTRADFDDLCDRVPALHRMLTSVLVHRINDLTERVAELMYTPADRRVCRRLAALAATFAPDATPVDLPVTQNDLASMAGTTRPTATLALADLEAAGVIRRGRDQITVLDQAALARHC